MQLGTYMYALDKPGQLLYIGHMGAQEWAFDLPQLPEMWEPYVQQVAKLFAENPGEDVRPFPCERMYCASCPWADDCPQELPGVTDELTETQRELLALTTRRYIDYKEAESAAKKEAATAKEQLLGYRHLLGADDKGANKFSAPGLSLRIADRHQMRFDQAAAKELLAQHGEDEPMKESVFPVVTARSADE